MSSEQDLNIRLQLIDKISANLAKVQQNIKKTKDTSDSFSESLKKTATSISHVSTSLVFLGGAITVPLFAAFNKASESSLAYANTVERVKISIENLNNSIASSLAPVMEKFAGILQNLVRMWEELPQSTRDAIVQTTLLIGVFLTLAGTVGKVVANIIKVGIAFGSFIASANPVVLAILAIVGALVAMTVYWEKVRDVAVKVMNIIEIGLTGLAIGFDELRKVIQNYLHLIISEYQQLFSLLSKVRGPQQNFFIELAGDAEQMRIKMAGAIHGTNNDLKLLKGHLDDLMKGNKGILAEGLEDSIKRVRTAIENIKNGVGKIFDTSNLPAIKKQFDGWTQIARQTAGAMSNALGEGFFNIVKGKFSELKNVAANFGDSIIKILTQVLAKYLLIKTLGSAFPGLIPFFHNGGVVRKAHTGMIANDEVPIIAQAGEGIISRRGMQSLGRQNLSRINQGGSVGGGGMSVQVTQVIQAWDTADIFRNKKNLANAVAQEIANNATIREVMRKYR